MIREPKSTIKSSDKSWKCEQMQLLRVKIVRTYTPYAFPGLFDSEVLQQVKKFNMVINGLKGETI
jgi:hypothetical protein